MSRVKENEKVRKEIDEQVNDENVITSLLIHPEKASSFILASAIPILYDISKSLAVIADKLSEVQQDGEENTAGENVNRM